MMIKHSPGFRRRRGQNWVALGLLYASYYMCRYNFRYATPGMVEEFGFSTTQISDLFGFWALAYGTGQLINGLISDAVGGKRCMLFGALTTIIINLIFGFSSLVGSFFTFGLLSLMNGYFQAFGAPGMVKINAAWFHRTERGTFAGIFGFMIQAGQIAINALAPAIIGGIVIGSYVIGGSNAEWRWVFRIPPLFTVAAAIFMALAAKQSPDEAGFPGEIEDEIRFGLGCERQRIGEHEKGPVAEQGLVAILRPGSGHQHDGRERPIAVGHDEGAGEGDVAVVEPHVG